MSKSSVIARSHGCASPSSHLALPLADQLYSVIKDYDVCLLVAQLYIQMRTIDATEECREFYMSRIWEEKPGLPGIREQGSLGALASQVHLWNPAYIEVREQMTKHRWRRSRRPGQYRRPPGQSNLKSKISRYHLVYLTSERGIRSCQGYRATASSWSIKNPDKEIITLKEKLDDLKLIPARLFIEVVSLHELHPRSMTRLLMTERNL